MSNNNYFIRLETMSKAQFPAFNDPLSAKWSFFENAGGSYVPNNVIERFKSLYDLDKGSALCRV